MLNRRLQRPTRDSFRAPDRAVETDRSGNDDHRGQRERQQEASNHSIGNTVHLVAEFGFTGGKVPALPFTAAPGEDS